MSTIYARARAEIERRGWRQGPSNDPTDFDDLTPGRDEPCCLVLALSDADRDDPGLEQFMTARARILEKIGRGSVILWNDAPGRTVEDVFALLDQLDAEATAP